MTDALDAIATATWWSLLTLAAWPSLLFTLAVTLGNDLGRAITRKPTP